MDAARRAAPVPKPVPEPVPGPGCTKLICAMSWCTIPEGRPTSNGESRHDHVGACGQNRLCSREYPWTETRRPARCLDPGGMSENLRGSDQWDESGPARLGAVAGVFAS